MAVTALDLVPSKAMENTQSTQYTAENATALIDKFTVTNVSGGIVTFSVNLVPSGESAGNSNLIIDEKSLAEAETYTCPEAVGHIITNGGFISTIASAASSITLRGS